VSVMPTCAPESWVDNVRSASPMPAARLSPAAIRRSTAAGSSATSENSEATNTAVPAVRTTPKAMSSQSVTSGAPWVRYVGARRS